MNNNLAELIKFKRNEKGLSQRALAKKINVSNTIISRIENGDVKKPSLDILIKLSNELNVFYIELLELAGYPKEETYLININNLEPAERIIGSKNLLKYVTKTDIDLVLDILKILENYKNGNIDYIQTIQLIALCNTYWIDDQLVYMTYKGIISCQKI